MVCTCPLLMKKLLKLALLTAVTSVIFVLLLDGWSNDDDVSEEENEVTDLFGPHQENLKTPIYLPFEEPTDMPIIVWWTPFIPHDRKVWKCSRGSCLVTKSRAELANPNTEVSVFMFYGSDLQWQDMPLPRKSHHMWALLNEESPKNNWVFTTEKGISLFNITSTYSRYSHYPLVLHYLHTLKNLSEQQRVPTSKKSTGGLGLVLYIQTDCNPPSDRDSYVEELMKYVKVDSYGKCLHNKDLPEHLQDSLTFNAQEVLDIVAQYKFAIAFENSVCHDYITEKFWRPLYAGTVPIVYGSPTVKDWAPTERSIILAEDFVSPKDLADYLLELDRDDTKYNEYLEFKRTGITNKRLLDSYSDREWTVDDDFGLNFIDGFQCYVCDELHKRQSQKRPEPLVATHDHCVCPTPEPMLKHTGDTVEERIKMLNEQARTEMTYWRGIASCAEEFSDVLERGVSAGDTQDELNQRIKNDCTNLCAQRF